MSNSGTKMEIENNETLALIPNQLITLNVYRQKNSN